MLTGTKNSRRIIDIKRVANAFFDAYCETDTIDKSKLFKSLLGYHCFTGSDSISAFCGKGKIKALSVSCKDKSFIQAFYNLGQTNELSEETILSLERFVCNLYGKSSNSENQADINQLRYAISCQKRVKVETLPPCQNVLRQHMKRSNYQTYIWRKSRENFVSEDSPVNHGWFINNDQLDILWMTCKPAPDEVNIPVLMLLV